MEGNLDLLEEKREEEEVRVVAYRKRMVEYFNKIVKYERLRAKGSRYHFEKIGRGEAQAKFEKTIRHHNNQQTRLLPLGGHEREEATLPKELKVAKKMFRLQTTHN